MQLYDTKAQMRLKKFDLVGFATNTEYSTTILYAEKRSEADQAKLTNFAPKPWEAWIGV